VARRTDKHSDRTAATAPAPAGGRDFAAVLAKLDIVIAEQHELRRLVHRMTVVTEVVNLKEAARRLSRTTRTVEKLFARNVFSDGRAPDNRVRGANLVFYADEVEVYRAEGVKGVARLRKELGRG
jgi:hypothetical protein